MFTTFVRRAFYFFLFAGVFSLAAWLFVYQITDAETTNNFFLDLSRTVFLLLALLFSLFIMGVLSGLLKLILRELKERKLASPKTNRSVPR